MSAGEITAEIDRQVVARHDSKEYWILGESDISNLPSVGDFEPIPDPATQLE